MKATEEVSEKKSDSIGKTASLVAVLTIVSKVLGLVRDQVVAFTYATSFLADAYNYAFLFTGNILILFGGLGGPFHSATVAMLAPRKEDPKSGEFISQILVFTGLILTVATVVLCLVADPLVHLIARNYSPLNEPVRAKFFSECIYQVRVMSPLVLIAGLIGVTYGVLNVFNKIFWPSLSPAIASIAIIVALLLFPGKDSSVPLAVGSMIGAFGQLFAQCPGMLSCNLNYRFAWKIADGIRDYCSMLLPAAVGTSIGQLTVYIDSFFCSQIEGGWTAISMSNRLVQLPLGILITAMLVPLLPRFSEQALQNRIGDLKEEFRRALSILWFISIPLTMVLIVLPRPIIQLLFEHRNFKASSTEIVTTALVFLTPSIIIYIARDLITRVFYGFQDSKTPFLVALVAICVKAVLDWYFVMILKLGVGGISLATSLITVMNFTLLAILLRRKIGLLGFSKILKPFALMLGAAVAGGVVTYCLYALASAAAVPKSLRIFALIAQIGLAAVPDAWFTAASVLP